MPRASISGLVLLVFGATGFVHASDVRPPTTEAERRVRPPSIESDESISFERALSNWGERSVGKIASKGVYGVRPKLGSMTPGSGFALGAEYMNEDLAGGHILVRASARSSLRGFRLYDAHFALPKLAGDHVFVSLLATRRDYPRLGYFGSGPESSDNARTSFRLRDTSYELTAGVRPVSRLRLGASGGFLRATTAPGEDPRFLSVEQVFSPAVLPGVGVESEFLVTRGFVDFDGTDHIGGPRSGGYYSATYSNYLDRTLGAGTHRRLELRAQQYVPFFNKQRILAFRGYSILTDTAQGRRIPFYLLPTLGGPDTLRGFPAYRFYGENLFLMNAEYRWKVSGGVEMALFADSGKVFQRVGSFDLKNLETSYGGGIRFNSRGDVFMRLDLGCSDEGCQIWLRFNNMF